MKVIVMADTHMPKKSIKFPSRLCQELENAELIIHAGDWQTLEVYEELKKFGEVHGVYGNVDDEDIIQQLPKKKVIDLDGWKIGIVHGDGEKKTTEKRAMEAFEEELDVIIFGHSHLPLLRYIGKTMLFNPGSATDKRKLPFYSFGKLTLSEEIHAEHIFWKKGEK
ncbi:metallophosphoesterase family protein [Alteribacillus sp. YIM 98480]|uniref:metallophosphoesterase family protein n=1 Tax=Alteribacillus sp. YIM 98480 TaxID=2606599 RepID=UPI00131CCD4F|nr:metallophosphoesterase family protein [Alteribacillus sp. YIM 98480]